jgi:hypothetical protein
MGVIDDRDLAQMVREQLSEIVFDTFRWPDGDYSFVSGELPSFEEITLEVTVQSLVAEGLRRVNSWNRIQEGCGGLEAPLGLTPTYLDVLDRWDAGPEEWQVINALKTPASPREICGKLDLPDFRVCQILWALRVLAAVEIAALPEPAVPVKVEVLDMDAEPVETSEPEPGRDEMESEPWPEPLELEPQPMAEVEPAPGRDEEPSPEATQLISRELVEAALRSDEEDESDEEAEQPVYDEPDESVRTVRLSREEVDAAIRGEEQTAPLPAETEEPPWEAPAGLDEIISRFNAVQRVVYRAVRSEVGAGAANLIRACCGADDPAEGPLGGSELQKDGTWDAETLRRAVMDHRIEDPWLEYQGLIEAELETLRAHIGEGKVLELQRQIEEAEQTHVV